MLPKVICQPYNISSFLPLFLNERLARLTVESSESSGSDLDKVKPLLSYLPDRCPTLRHLNLRVHEVHREDMGFEGLLSPPFRLTEPEIPPTPLTPCVMHALAILESLESPLSTTHLWPIPEQKQPLRPLVDIRHWFSSLTTLELSGSFVYLISFLQAYNPSGLRHLTLDPDAHKTREQHHTLYQIVTSCCPKLEKLYLVKWGSGGSVIRPQRWSWLRGTRLCGYIPSLIDGNYTRQ